MTSRDGVQILRSVSEALLLASDGAGSGCTSSAAYDWHMIDRVQLPLSQALTPMFCSRLLLPGAPEPGLAEAARCVGAVLTPAELPGGSHPCCWSESAARFASQHVLHILCAARALRAHI